MGNELGRSRQYDRELLHGQKFGGARKLDRRSLRVVAMIC